MCKESVNTTRSSLEVLRCAVDAATQLLAVPIAGLTADMLGALEAYNRRDGRPLSEGDRRLLERFTQIIGPILERVIALTALCEAEMGPQPVDERRMEDELRGAIDRGELVLNYHPEVEFRSGRIVGVEALVRWQHPQRGTLLPASFIPIAEQTGLVVSLGGWVLEQACRQAQAWQRFGSRRKPVVVSVNFSAAEFQQPGIVNKVARTLRETGLHAGALMLEITETTMTRAAAATVRTLRALKDLGVRLAIDDFGTGYSALSYLRQFPVDTLKIDRSFVGELERRPETREIVRAVTRMARALGMDVTAEGIETPQQQELLSALQCRRGQGYYFWRPLPGDAVTELLRAQSEA